jgi:hypothetical protein
VNLETCAQWTGHHSRSQPAIHSTTGAKNARGRADVSDYTEFVEAVRDRADELMMTRSELDFQAGHQDGYSGKLLGRKHVKRFGFFSLGPALGALGLKILLIEDTAQTAKIRARMKVRSARSALKRSPAGLDRQTSGAATDLAKNGNASLAGFLESWPGLLPNGPGRLECLSILVHIPRFQANAGKCMDVSWADRFDGLVVGHLRHRLNQFPSLGPIQLIYVEQSI